MVGCPDAEVTRWRGVCNRRVCLCDCACVCGCVVYSVCYIMSPGCYRCMRYVGVARWRPTGARRLGETPLGIAGTDWLGASMVCWAGLISKAGCERGDIIFSNANCGK